MIAVRGIVESLEEVISTIVSFGGQFQSEYAFKDEIYVPKEGVYDLNKEFLRIRVYTKSAWKTKRVILVQKRTDFISEGKQSRIILKEEFDKEEEAASFMQTRFSSMKFSFAYARTGTQYQLGHLRIFAEAIEGYFPSVEVEANTAEEAALFLNRLHPKRIVKKTMPAEIKDMLGK